MARHVFVETNWVVDYAAPAHRQRPVARDLLAQAQKGEIELHLPAICLSEARITIQRKFRPRNETDAIRHFLAHTAQQGRMSSEDRLVVLRALDMFDSAVNAELGQLAATLAALRDQPAVDVFVLDQEMLERSLELGASDLELGPVDQAILAAILIRAQRIRVSGEETMVFCERDADLLPWTRHGQRKDDLAELYEQVGLKVYRDFDIRELD